MVWWLSTQGDFLSYLASIVLKIPLLLMFYGSLMGYPIGMFAYLDWSKIGSWSLWYLLWILSIPSLLRVREWIEFVGNLPRVGKKRILLIKEKQKKHKEFTVVNNGKRNDKTKQPLIYSNRRNKIRKGRTIWETPTSRPIKEGPLAKL